MDPVVDVVVRSALTLLFAAAAVHKLRDRARFRATLAAYRLGPERLAGFASGAVVVAELAVAAGLVSSRARTPALAGAGLLLLAYAAAIAVNLWRGRRDIDCGCLGAAGRETLTWWLVGRNLVLVGVALTARVAVEPRPLVWVDAVTTGGIVAVAALGWLALDGLLANGPAVARARGLA